MELKQNNRIRMQFLKGYETFRGWIKHKTDYSNEQQESLLMAIACARYRIGPHIRYMDLTNPDNIMVRFHADTGKFSVKFLDPGKIQIMDEGTPEWLNFMNDIIATARWSRLGLARELKKGRILHPCSY